MTDLLLLNNEALFSLPINLELIGEECTKHLTTCSGPSSLKETARQLARELIERNLVSVLRKISLDQHRVAVRDEMIQLLLRQMTGQLPSSLIGNSSNNTKVVPTMNDGISENNNDNSSSSASTSVADLLPAGSDNMARLISQGAVSVRGSAVTIKRLLEAQDAPVRKTALALLAKVAEGCAKERREALKVFKEQQAQQAQQTQQHQSRKNKFNNKKQEPAPTTSLVPPPFSATARAMELLRPTILDLLKNEPSCAYECNFICRCFGWIELPTMNITSHEALGLVRRSHRNVPCFSLLAGNLPEYDHISSFVATCSRDAPTIDIFRDVNISGDYAFSSFTVPQQFTPLSLVSLATNKNNKSAGDSDADGVGNNNSNSNLASNLVTLCCGVEVSERVGLGVIGLDDSFPLSSQTHQCDVKEVFGVSQPTCGISMGRNSPAIAVGCAVPGGFGVTTVVVETTQRIHTYSSSSSDCVTALTTAFGSDSCIISATRDGSMELWDLRCNPRGPTQTIVASSSSSKNKLSLLNNNNNITNNNKGGAGNLPMSSATSSTADVSNAANGVDAMNNNSTANNNNGSSNNTRKRYTTSSSDATTALSFLSGGSGYSNNLLVSGTSDGLVSVWDLRAVHHNQQQEVGSSTLYKNHGIPARPLTSMRLDGSVLSIASIPSASSSKNNSNATSAYFAVSTTKTLSTHRLNASPDDEEYDDDDEDDYYDDDDEQNQDNNGAVEDEDKDAVEQQQQQSRKAPPTTTTARSFHRRDGLLSTQQMIACRSTTNPVTGQVVPCLYHDLSVVKNFAGGKHTYVLAGGSGGVIESFRVRQ